LPSVANNPAHQLTETIKGAEHPLRLLLCGYRFALQQPRRATPCPHKRKTPRRGLRGVFYLA